MMEVISDDEASETAKPGSNGRCLLVAAVRAPNGVAVPEPILTGSDEPQQSYTENPDLSQGRFCAARSRVLKSAQAQRFKCIPDEDDKPYAALPLPSQTQLCGYPDLYSIPGCQT